ncbi:HPr family phosphocarrier protein [Thiotrichales bacterium 19S3-7]|nr:HPr family phosphocarrier protein [Thiotrichales bacterium 19S3-7]MCF6801108.1 HPr family phosphocarrier protein [Thiotrichales bacterium 19S3-11]
MMNEYKKTVAIKNKLGLHARAASKLVSLASRYESESKLLVLPSQIGANCKSIMGLMMLAASCGTDVVITANGKDAQDAVDAIVQLIDQRFGEAE